MVDNAAAELARKRWEKTTAEERSEIGRKLNEAKYAGMTKKERSEAARKAVQARWAKKKKSTKK